tara:strand:+ start:2392 stop:2649 length:258 start_codon:yes stop_codon:yes gene_type:complete
MRVNKIHIGQEVMVDDGIEIWRGKVMKKCDGRSCFQVKDINPNGEEIWHEKKGGGAWKEQYINGFFGEVTTVKAKQIIEIVKEVV